MKHILQVILALLFIILLNSCERKSNYDLFEFLDVLNNEYDYNIIYEDFEIIFDKNYQYSYKLNENTIITFYCDEKNEIFECAITSTIQPDDEFNSLWQNIACILVPGNTKNSEISKTRNGWVISKINIEKGLTILITKSNNKINHTEISNIKDYIEEDKITRPQNNKYD